jgi:hypothetical protein
VAFECQNKNVFWSRVYFLPRSLQSLDLNRYMNFIQRLFASAVFVNCCVGSLLSFGQSPEISLREFASGQIKKGVRSIGMGGNGATLGNYSLVWKDTLTALADAGVSQYSNGNVFSFTAAGFNTPALWHRMAIYIIALSQYTADASASVRSAGLGSGSVPVHGNGTNQGIFFKAGMPLGKGFSAGVLLSYERSQFSAVSDGSPGNYVWYRTNWLPSGGVGIAWQPNEHILAGVRALFNHDWEIRKDNLGSRSGVNLAYEYRAGVLVALWKGAYIDAGGNFRYRHNQISNRTTTNTAPNLGFEQNLWKKHFAIRGGLDETSPAFGLSARFAPIIMDVAYINDLGKDRIGSIFGSSSNSIIATVIYNYGRHGH